jgi:hypothetical protein
MGNISNSEEGADNERGGVRREVNEDEEDEDEEGEEGSTKICRNTFDGRDEGEKRNAF